MAATIIFDLGGVLVHLDWNKVCAPLARLSDRGYAAVLKEVQNGPIVESSMLGHLTPQEFHRSLCAKIHVDIPFDPFIEIWNGLLSPDEDMAALVEELGSVHRLVLASNTDAIHLAFAQEHFSVMQAFDRFFLSYEMGLLKPDPAYFHHILYGLQVPPSDCVFIDDRPENVQSARNVGMNALVFKSIGKLKSDLSGLSL
ncbi:MAG: HAD family phosphatase [Chloroflexi bacterium]|nr:HAD family phosphatase [Chloroflexota bacterium]